MPRAQDAQERPLAGRSASMKPNFARNTAIPKLMTVSLGGLHAIPGAVAEFFFGPSPAIPGGSFAQHEASLQNCWAHPTLTAFRQGRSLSGIQLRESRAKNGWPTAKIKRSLISDERPARDGMSDSHYDCNQASKKTGSPLGVGFFLDA